MGTKKSLLILRRYIIPVAFFFIAWEIISFLTPDIFWPTLGGFFIKTFEILTDAEIYYHLLQTLRRSYTGWVIGATLGAVFGVAIGESDVISDTIKPYVTLFRFIPAISWIGVFIIWFGVGMFAILAMVVYTSTVLSMLPSLNGMIYARSLTERIRAAQIMGGNRWDIFFKVKIPTALPQIWTGIRTALSIAFLQIVAAEMLVATNGLGYTIWIARSYFMITRMFVAIFMLGFAGYISDLLLHKLGCKIFSKYGIK